MSQSKPTVNPPLWLLAELTYRCPLQCPYCSNPLDFARQDKELTTEQWIEVFRQARAMGSVQLGFSGGEPLMQNGLAAAVAEVKELGFLIGLHTGGYRPKHLAEVLPLVDWIGFDVKAPFEREKYKTAVGGADHLHEAEESLKLLTESGVDFECRTTCDPRILTIEDIYMIAGELKARGVEKYFLQKYRPVESDKTSTDADCERFFLDKELLEHLRACFRVFDVRR